ncbi:putative protein kinase [Trypanosoma grayi]|uniref:putative protein kinase n=1 Tax=Trypanosoma grayi TaxID=71804 RepID=UPI0004F400A3|nr:putative protein kinase [Trypanosoma grayi]KEG14614.1 putative protein kinase [Trypanosoma grayi]
MASAVAATSPSCSIKRVSRYQFDPETDVIGKGAYGEVYRATLIKPKNENGTGGETAAKNGSVFALKKTMCGSKEEGMPVSTIREIMVLKEIGATMQRAAQDATSDTLGFENIVPLYDVCMEKDVVYMASEYCDAGDLASYLKKQPRHRLSDRWQYRRWMRDLLHGLCFLHRKEISHRDLKPQNLVLKTVPNKEDTKGVSVSGGEEEEPTKSTRYVLKITDFGLSRVEGIPVKKYQHEAVTLWYRSPDVLLGNTNYSYTADMWSAGCIIAEVASGKAIFHGRNNVDQLKCIFSRLVPPTECNFPSMKRYALCDKFAATLDVLHTGISHQNSNGAGVNSPFDGVKESLYSYFRSYEALDVVGEDGVDLLTHLLAYEPKYRFTVEEALQHPFFTTLSRSVSPAPELRTFSAPHLMEEERRSSLMSGRNARDSESQRAELRAKSLCLPSECQEVWQERKGLRVAAGRVEGKVPLPTIRMPGGG